MSYVNQRYNSRPVYDHSCPEIDHSVFKKCNWSEFYTDAKEATPMNVSESQGKEVVIYMFMDSDQAWNKVSCRSRSDFLIYENTALVQWFSKKQSAMETSVFHIKFVIMIRCSERLKV